MVCLWLGAMSRFLPPFVRHSSPPQAFPPVPEERKPNSRLQERLLKKLGQHAHPFYFTVSPTEKTGIGEVKDHVVCVEKCSVIRTLVVVATGYWLSCGVNQEASR